MSRTIDTEYLAEVTEYMQTHTIRECAEKFSVEYESMKNYVAHYHIQHPKKHDLIYADIMRNGSTHAMNRFGIHKAEIKMVMRQYSRIMKKIPLDNYVMTL